MRKVNVVKAFLEFCVVQMWRLVGVGVNEEVTETSSSKSEHCRSQVMITVVAVGLFDEEEID